MKNSNKNSNSSNRIFDDYWDDKDIVSGLKRGDLVQGVLRINPNRRKVAYLTVENLSVDVCINDETSRNRSFDGDTVVVEVFPTSDWLNISSAASINNVNIEFDESNEEKGEALWKPKENLLGAFASKKLHGDSVPKSKIETSIQALHMQPTGKVVKIVTPGSRKGVVGALVPSKFAGDNSKFTDAYCIFEPSDGRYPHLLVPRMQLPEAFVHEPQRNKSNIFVLDIDPYWPHTSKMAFGENVRSIGEMGGILAETEALLLENGVTSAAFTTEMLQPLMDLLQSGKPAYEEKKDADSSVISDPIQQSLHLDVDWSIPLEEIARRRDLRGTRIFTIDPATAKDLDDALHITPLPDGTFEVGVHIADVSYFLRPDTALDAEAEARATSVYLVQRVIPMLPSILCEQLCSINPNVERLAFSCIFNLTADGELTDRKPWYGRTVIKSCAKLDYATAQRMVDGLIPFEPSPGSDPDSFLADIPESVWERERRPPKDTHFAHQVSSDVRLLHSVGMRRRRIRLGSGALVLNQPKLTFRLDEFGNPFEVGTYQLKESNFLVEEYMLLANYLVAEKLVETVGEMAFLRCHKPPKVEKFGELVSVANGMGFEVDIHSAKTLQLSLNRIAATAADKVTMQVINSLAMQPMTTAEYFVASDSGSATWSHYALAIKYYTHFTSPIRRYADVTVHRLLEEGLRLEALGQSVHGDVADLNPEDTPHVHPDLVVSGGPKHQQHSDAQTGAERRNKLRKLKMIADNCNERKRAAKAAQDRSDEVFFGIYLAKLNQPMVASAVVISVGEKSFTVLVPDFGLRERIFVDKISGVTSEYDNENRQIILFRDRGASGGGKAKSSAGNDELVRVISVMRLVRVSITQRIKPPIAIDIKLVLDDDSDSISSVNGDSLPSDFQLEFSKLK